MEEIKNEQVEVKDTEVTNTENTQEVTKTYTQEELDKLLQAETDRKVSKALETSKAKWQQEYEAKLQAEKSEAEKLAKMTESERYEAQLKAEREQFEKERAEFKKAQLEAQTIKELSSVGLPTEFSSYLLADDAETIKSNIDTFKTKWIDAIEKAVDERLKGSTPQTSNKVATTLTKDQFGKLNYHERAKMLQENPNLLQELGL